MTPHELRTRRERSQGKYKKRKHAMSMESQNMRHTFRRTKLTFSPADKVCHIADKVCPSCDKRQNGSAAPHHLDVPFPTFLVDTAPNQGPKGGYVARVKGKRAREDCPIHNVKANYASAKPELNKRVRHFLGMYRRPRIETLLHQF